MLGDARGRHGDQPDLLGRHRRAEQRRRRGAGRGPGRAESASRGQRRRPGLTSAKPPVAGAAVDERLLPGRRPACAPCRATDHDVHPVARERPRQRRPGAVAPGPPPRRRCHGDRRGRRRVDQPAQRTGGRRRAARRRTRWREQPVGREMQGRWPARRRALPRRRAVRRPPRTPPWTVVDPRSRTRPTWRETSGGATTLGTPPRAHGAGVPAGRESSTGAGKMASLAAPGSRHVRGPSLRSIDGPTVASRAARRARASSSPSRARWRSSAQDDPRRGRLGEGRGRVLRKAGSAHRRRRRRRRLGGADPHHARRDRGRPARAPADLALDHRPAARPAPAAGTCVPQLDVPDAKATNEAALATSRTAPPRSGCCAERGPRPRDSAALLRRRPARPRARSCSSIVRPGRRAEALLAVSPSWPSSLARDQPRRRPGRRSGARRRRRPRDPRRASPAARDARRARRRRRRDRGARPRCLRRPGARLRPGRRRGVPAAPRPTPASSVDEALALIEFRYAATDEQFPTHRQAARRPPALGPGRSSSARPRRGAPAAAARGDQPPDDEQVRPLGEHAAHHRRRVRRRRRRGRRGHRACRSTSALGVPDAFGRRIARNTSLAADLRVPRRQGRRPGRRLLRRREAHRRPRLAGLGRARPDRGGRGHRCRPRRRVAAGPDRRGGRGPRRPGRPPHAAR